MVQNVDATPVPPTPPGVPEAMIQDLTNVAFDGTITGESLEYPFNDQYLVEGSVGDQGYEGVVNVNFYALDLTETQAAAVPEPSSLSLLAAGVLGLFLFARRRAQSSHS